MPGVNLELPCDAYTGDERYIFISYAHKDAEIVYPEIRRHDQLGYRIWYDEGIDPGNEWPEEVAKALYNCSQFIVFVTTNSINSKNVKREINYALKLEKPFLAIHLEETNLPPAMDLQMSSIQAILKWQMNENTYIKKIKRSYSQVLGETSLIENINDEKMQSLNSDTSSDIIGFAANKIAEEVHNFWKRLGDKEGWELTYHTDFENLPPHVKKENIAAILRIPRILDKAGYTITDNPLENDERLFKKDLSSNPKLLEKLAIIEHDGWCKYKEDTGWTYNAITNYPKKQHNCLISFDQMSPKDQDKDRNVIRNIPADLAKGNLYVTKNDQ